ncbi:ARID/BRIGHT DNA-binding domain-containing protein [Striga asiatica]|uniref:ARID/BRIGHT DNA-binding domain-containing protein n=1 Tax=Striga asiatica TaxID=4170 RepID=A0A5A7Q2M7_STRAF|nr:ARID/BRIGHT DNA-binding domain-containing protein [Striga asiatica]
MVKDDVEIEDAVKKDRDSENNIEELDSKALDSKNETTRAEGEKLPFLVTDAENANKSDGIGQCLNELKKEAEDVMVNEMKAKIDPQTETKESITVKGSTGELMDSFAMNDEKSSTKNNVDEQALDKQSDAKSEMVEQNASICGVEKDEKSTENVVEVANPVENALEANAGGDVSVEKHEDGEGTDPNAGTGSDKNMLVPVDVPPNEAPSSGNAELDKAMTGGNQEMEDASDLNEEKTTNDELKDQGKEILLKSPMAVENTKTIETAAEHKSDHPSLPVKHESATPSSLVRYSPARAGDQSGETISTVFTPAALPLMAEDDNGTPEEQAAFMKMIESFYRERATDFKQPKFYGQPLNCLKLWRAVIRLGGYDRVTGSKLWRQVGESFHPPKTCTTVSWTFRIFYEKSLLEYEKHKIQSGELELPVDALNEASGADTEVGNGFQGAGSGRARRDSAARAMQGWHVQRLFDNGEVGEPDKGISNTTKREKIVKAIGSLVFERLDLGPLKHKRPSEVENPAKATRVEASKQLATTVVDVGPPADWVKINVRQTKDSFEVYALVPGLLREEVRVQSDPAGRLVITGQPEQVDNPWGITPFKKVISLPSRIDPLQTSAVVSLHGRLFVRVPLEQSNS